MSWRDAGREGSTSGAVRVLIAPPILTILAMACSGGGSAGGSPCIGGSCGVPGEIEEPRELSTLVGYGVVNRWPVVDAESFAELLRDAGLTLTAIEYLPWFGGEECECKLGGGCSTQTFPDEAARFVEAMRAEGITTVINVVNWNNCAAREKDEQWFRERMAEIVEGIGTESVVLSAVSEPWVRPSRDPRDWTEIARASWSGVFIAPNGGGSDPEPMWSDLEHDLVDVHHCRDADLLDGLAGGIDGLLHSTDCSLVVNPGAERAALFTREALRNEANLLIYGFDDPEPDLEVIEAMGDEVTRWRLGED